MHLIALLRKKMLPKAGTLNFIDFRIRFILIGMVSRRRSKVWLKIIIISKMKRSSKSAKEAITGAKTGTLDRHSKQFY
jgi:hypothetical protein